MTEAGVVVCPQPMAAEVGVEVLAEGGNAVDAAVAVGFVQTVIDPPMAGLGGFGTMLYRDGESGEVHCLDFPARAGGATRPDQWVATPGPGLVDRFGFSVEGLLNDSVTSRSPFPAQSTASGRPTSTGVGSPGLT